MLKPKKETHWQSKMELKYGLSFLLWCDKKQRIEAPKTQ